MVQKKRGSLGANGLRLLGAVAALAVIFWYLDGLHLRLEKDIGWGALALSFLCTFAMTATESRRWQKVAHFFHSGMPLSFSQAFFYVSSMTAVGSVTIPTVAASLGQAALLKKGREISLVKSVGITLYPRLFDIVTLALLVGPGALWAMGSYGDRVTEAGIATLFLSLALAVAIWCRPLYATRLILKGIMLVGPLIPPLKRRLDGSAFATPPDEATLRSALSLTVFRFGMIVLRIYFLLAAFSLDFGVFDVLFAVPVIQLSMLLSFAPGALGTLELGWTTVLLAKGLAAVAVSSFLVWNRVFFTLFNFGVCLIAWIVYRTAGR